MAAFDDLIHTSTWPNQGGRFEQSAVLLDVFDLIAHQESLPKYL